MARAWQRNRAARAKFQDVIDAVPKEVQAEVSSALAKSGREAVAIIKGDVPVRQGKVKRSVRWSYGDPPKIIRGSGEIRSTRVPKRMRISIWAGGPLAPHAHLVHNGTAARFRSDGTSTGIMPPQPFFWPNIRSLRRRQKGRITRQARKGIRKAAL